MTDTEFHQMIDARRDVIEAFLNKRECETRWAAADDPRPWCKFDSSNFSVLFDSRYNVRIKPQLQLVPWTFETVPKGVFWMRRKLAIENTLPSVVTALSKNCLYLFEMRISFDAALDDFEWSYDRAEWKPCGTEVGG